MNAPASPVNSEITSEETAPSSARKRRIPWLAVMAGILLTGYVAAYLLLSVRYSFPGFGWTDTYMNVYAINPDFLGCFFWPAELCESSFSNAAHGLGYSHSLERAWYIHEWIFTSLRR